MMRFAGLITAAGLSSRMNGFKPLLEINGFPMITMTVQSMRNAGIREITVVAGYRGQDVCRALAGMDVSIVWNEKYASTDMFDSVRLGLAGSGQADGVFFLPADVPMTSPVVFRKMIERIPHLKSGCQALIPFVEERVAEPLPDAGERVLSDERTDMTAADFSKRQRTTLRQIHPPLILKTGWQAVMEYGGERGLGGALSDLTAEKIIVNQEDASDDADYRTEFALLERQAKARRGVSKKLCEAFYEEVSLPDHIREHCFAVGELAGWMAERLVEHGAFLDVELCRSGGYLHDLLRLEPHHAEAAGAFLEERGYFALAEVVRAHMGFPESSAPEQITVCRESAVVCLADKLIRETRRVTLEQRYQKALAHENVKPRILRDLQICRRLAEEFEVITGEKL